MAMLHVPGTILFHFYEIVSNIGQGGMGAVYKARDMRTDEVVAIKQMRPDSPAGFMPAELKERFDKEWTALHNLDHPRIPRMLASFSQGDCGYYVMEFVEGDSLDQVLLQYRERQEPFPEILMLEYALQILEVLVYLHGLPRPMLHRDIKPQNIIVRKSRREIVLVDFGLVRASGSAGTKTMVGTLGYCPLEQVKGHPEPRSDLYAVGATMYHMLSGEPPAPFDINPLEKMRPDVHPGLADLVNRAVRSNPNQRYASAMKMEMAVRQLLAHLTGHTDDRLAQLYMEDEPYTIREEPAQGPMPTWVFFGSLAAAVAVVLFVLLGVAHLRSTWSGPRTQAGVGLNVTVQPQPPVAPAEAPAQASPTPPPHIKFEPAGPLQQQAAAQVLGPPFTLRGYLGQLSSTGGLSAAPNRAAGLLFQAAPMRASQIRFQIFRDRGPSNLQMQLQSARQGTTLGFACQADSSQGGYVNGIVLLRDGQPPLNGNVVLSPDAQFTWATLSLGVDRVRLELDGVDQVSEVPAGLSEFESLMVILTPSPLGQSVQLRHLSVARL